MMDLMIKGLFDVLPWWAALIICVVIVGIIVVLVIYFKKKTNHVADHCSERHMDSMYDKIKKSKISKKEIDDGTKQD